MKYFKDLHDESMYKHISIDMYENKFEVHYLDGRYGIPCIDIVRRTEDIDAEFFDYENRGEIKINRHI